MSVWQRITEVLASVSARTGDRIGAILDPDNWLPGGRDAAFTLALVALSAKMAMADGVVTASEIRAFQQTVEIPAEAETQINRFFNLARQDTAGYETYARKISRMFSNTPATLEHVLDGLFYIAAADGFVHQDEMEYLKSVSDIFGFDEARFEQMTAQYLLDHNGGDPYLVLGLTPGASKDEVRRVYLGLVREYHPDRLAAKGVPEEMMGLVTARMAAINAAYELISNARRV